MGLSKETPLFERAVEQSGYFFRHYALVHGGDLGELTPKGQAVRRALCYDGESLFIAESKDSLAKGTVIKFDVKAADASTYVKYTLVLIADEAPKASIKPTIAAAPKMNWQSAILANRGAVALFDMQGRVMWKAKLPVSEADVRNAAAQVQGRKILQVNKQTWTIK